MKPFSTYEEQVKLLKSRGLIILNDTDTTRVLERENYYNIINGYNKIFLAKDKNGNKISPETYIKYTTFEEIHSLFTFDRELRNIFIKYLLIFENSIKTKLAYRFSEKFIEPHAYLQLANFSKDELNRTLNLIAIISNIIKNKSSDRYKNPIKHYLNSHGHVPLWVLINDLTSGNVSNFYQALDEPLKDKIAKDFSLQFKREYKSNFQIPKDSIVDILKISNLIRNICAHEERLYNFVLNSPTKTKHNSNLLGIPSNKLNGNLFTMFSFLKLVLPKNDHIALKKSLDSLFNKYEKKFFVISFSEILNITGFDPNWKTYF